MHIVDIFAFLEDFYFNITFMTLWKSRDIPEFDAKLDIKSSFIYLRDVRSRLIGCDSVCEGLNKNASWWIVSRSSIIDGPWTMDYGQWTMDNVQLTMKNRIHIRLANCCIDEKLNLQTLTESFNQQYLHVWFGSHSFACSHFHFHFHFHFPQVFRDNWMCNCIRTEDRDKLFVDDNNGRILSANKMSIERWCILHGIKPWRHKWPLDQWNVLIPMSRHTSKAHFSEMNQTICVVSWNAKNWRLRYPQIVI
jgi:hypothetical protein